MEDLIRQLALMSRKQRREFYRKNRKKVAISWEQFNKSIPKRKPL